MFDEFFSTPEGESSGQRHVTEPEMRMRPGLYPMPGFASGKYDWLEPVLRGAYITQPLLGNIALPSNLRAKLHTVASDALTASLGRSYLPEYGLSDFYSDILVLETALLLRGWTGADERGESGIFWEYIFNQYALPYDDSFGGSHAYKIFRTAIAKSLRRHGRLMVPTGQKYYTTMLIHALAPKAKFFALFEQIFAFYAETLGYRYIKNDTAFQAFSRAMKRRFESGRVNKDDNIHIKSVQSSSAIRELFLRCPGYMALFVERVVRAMDSLVASGTMEAHTYIDTLLVDWYGARSREAHVTARRARSRAGTERVITEFSGIRAAYRCEDGQVSLVIPSIRLGEMPSVLPRVTVYRFPGDEAPYSENLRYYGDDFCITSRRETIPIDALMPAGAARIEPRLVISHGGADIYDSGAKLYRDFIAFDDGGGEMTKRPDGGYVSVFTAEEGDFRGEDSAPDCSASVCGGGLLYRILIDSATFISINGTNLFPVEKLVSGLALNLSVAPVGGCAYMAEQRECAVFTAGPTLTITSESGQIARKYSLLIDGAPHHPPARERSREEMLSAALPDGPGVHELRIVENASRRQVHSLCYVVIADFSLRFDGFYYVDHFPENGALEISSAGETRRLPYKLLPGQQTMPVPFMEGELALSIPTLTCRLGGVPIPPEGGTLWHGDIAMSALLDIGVPRGYSCTIAVGPRLFEASPVELGNEIRAGHSGDTEPVGLILRKGEAPPVQVGLFDIAFTPRFKTEPLVAEGGGLLWCIEDNFIGDRESGFELSITQRGREIGQYSAGHSDAVIPLDAPLEDGVYRYAVSQKPSGFFGKTTEIFRGRFTVGDPALFRFEGRAVVVTEAITDHERVALRPASGIITKLRYLGELGLNGETQPYPCYEGTLHFKHGGALRPYAFREYESGGVWREQVNPVRLWLINAYTLSLRGPSDDGLYVSRKWESITDRTPSEWGLSHITNKLDYCNPDYYSFKIIDLAEVAHV
ncbi:hypothetical protein LJC32_01805 [Oscillospiraceae bacterium OttesenSCG-928-F05]|nr:hypothetical protein [Oscillospiraceae bacterium OttesenSCG-928-F05]